MRCPSKAGWLDLHHCAISAAEDGCERSQRHCSTGREVRLPSIPECPNVNASRIGLPRSAEMMALRELRLVANNSKILLREAADCES